MRSVLQISQILLGALVAAAFCTTLVGCDDDDPPGIDADTDSDSDTETDTDTRDGTGQDDGVDQDTPFSEVVYFCPEDVQVPLDVDFLMDMGAQDLEEFFGERHLAWVSEVDTNGMVNCVADEFPYVPGDMDLVSESCQETEYSTADYSLVRYKHQEKYYEHTYGDETLTLTNIELVPADDSLGWEQLESEQFATDGSALESGWGYSFAWETSVVGQLNQTDPPDSTLTGYVDYYHSDGPSGKVDIGWNNGECYVDMLIGILEDVYYLAEYSDQGGTDTAALERKKLLPEDCELYSKIDEQHWGYVDFNTWMPCQVEEWE